jgi:hypothetical protein
LAKPDRPQGSISEFAPAAREPEGKYHVRQKSDNASRTPSGSLGGIESEDRAVPDSRLAGAADIGRAVKGVREWNQGLVESI